MELTQTLETLGQLPSEEVRQWLVALALVLLAMGLVLWLEWRYFRRTQRGLSWLAVRCVSLVMAPVTLAAVVLPARATSGLEGLAVFYGMLLTVGPLLWFGSHRLAGRWVRPGLSGPESVALACLGLGLAAIPTAAFFVAQFALQEAARSIAGRPIAPGSQPALAHRVGPLQRFDMPGAGIVYAQSLLAPPGVRLEGVDTRLNGPWYDTKGSAHASFCADGNNLHLLWSAREPTPILRLHWAQDGQRLKAAWSPDLAQASAPLPFTVAFRSDGVDPIVPVPRARVQLELPMTADKPYLANLAAAQPDETTRVECLMPGYQRARWRQEPAISAVGINFYLPVGNALLRGWITRPSTN